LFQPGIGAPTRQRHVDACRCLRLPVECHVTDGDRATGSSAQPQQFVFDAEPGQPVAEVADRLVVAEIGLSNPAFWPRAVDHEAAHAVRFDGESAVVHRYRADHRAPRHDLGLRGTIGRHQVPQGECQRPQPFPADGRDLEHRPPVPSLDLFADEIGQFTGFRHIDLVEHHRPWPLGQITQRRITLQGRRVRGQLGFQGVDVGDRIAARL
jgi:hypothetical protein